MRNLSSAMITDITSENLIPAFFVQFTLTTGIQYLWTGYGNFTFTDGHVYVGVGDLGTIGPISEGIEVKADGTSIELSGIDQTYLGDALNEVQIGAPASITFATLTLNTDGSLSVHGQYPIFVGQVDKPSIKSGPESTISISLALENKMINHARATQRRYTIADQANYYPDDTGFVFVESLNDIALKWGIA